MGYRKNRTKGHYNNGFVVLQCWLRELLAVSNAKRRRQGNINELHKLSHYLLEDLGFDNEVKPLHWSSYSQAKPKSRSTNASSDRTCACQQHSQCDKVVGCLG